jgi:histone H3/H4
MIKDYLPESMRMSQQSSDLIVQLSMHFLNYLSDTSNNVCNKEGKKTITPTHVVHALKELKMHSYISEILKMENTDAVGEGSSNDDDSGSVKGGRGRGRGGQLMKSASRNPDELLSGLTAQETKKMIDRKLDKFGKKKRRKLGQANPSNMTEE